MTRATVALTSTVTLPQSTPVANVAPALEGDWTRFRRALESTPLQPCLSIAVEVSRTAEPIMNAMRVEQAHHDSTTRHGAT